MSDTTMTAQTARKLAELVATIRDWNPDAIATALWQVRSRPLAEVAAAAIRAAEDPRIETPAGIAWTDRPHWHPERDAPRMPTWRDPYRDTTPATAEQVAAFAQQAREAARKDNS